MKLCLATQDQSGFNLFVETNKLFKEEDCSIFIRFEITKNRPSPNLINNISWVSET